MDAAAIITNSVFLHGKRGERSNRCCKRRLVCADWDLNCIKLQQFDLTQHLEAAVVGTRFNNRTEKMDFIIGVIRYGKLA